ncbi:hypothetical protein DP113_25455 [Brasilonema octagenarum UFV-E1]|uniref:CHAT domain-containing protein n=1 Tax=Brasilonema sennae CENA114 TaxID=415709 RepID=A0A856MMT3_9CYAN|nr:CHAT domain-containing protein [Brasilonema sennae]QDL10821.1 hypothetical protein DP114_25545 [Brasilonema sennae CENA114]QDL17167.1 hypothetical protein DP113_25455 [Brasilonema octagenarum UFV-E1]
MKKLVLLKFDGKINSEFHVTLEIANDGETPHRIITGKLPGNNTITQLLNTWHDTYRSRYGQLRIKNQKSKNVNIEALNEECKLKSQQLLDSFNAWLQSSAFTPIRSCLEQLEPESEIRVIICTDCQELRKLPWHLWDVLTKYQGAEIALSSPQAERGNRTYREKIRILIILGDSRDINVDADKQELETYCGEAEIVLLKEPLREKLNQHLQDNIGWDILFFSGHSRTERTQGRIWLNSHDSLTMAELRDALQIAIERRLQVALFNSCDGLGIAYELEQLNIPQVIVMREPVPDKVAQEFLKFFLQHFTGGKSLYISVRNAREQLRSLEEKYPCASWLPVIVQNQTETPPTWQSLGIISFCPYQGLAAFGEANAEYFFGREKATLQLVSAVYNKPLVAVVGASGSGKSSLVFAGLIPQLRRDTVNSWLILSFRPLKNPFESLAKALVSAFNLEDDDRHLLEAKLELQLRKDTSTLQTTIERIQTLSPDSQRRLLLVGDQFEEIYTLCADASERKIFLDGLLQAVNNAPFFTLVLTLRADFFSKALDDYEPFGKALQDYQPELLVRMSREELEQAIALPATQLGFQLEQGLTNTIIQRFSDE